MLFHLKLRSQSFDAPPTSGVRAVTAIKNPINKQLSLPLFYIYNLLFFHIMIKIHPVVLQTPLDNGEPGEKGEESQVFQPIGAKPVWIRNISQGSKRA
jgi:hypothetical protein